VGVWVFCGSFGVWLFVFGWLGGGWGGWGFVWCGGVLFGVFGGLRGGLGFFLGGLGVWVFGGGGGWRVVWGGGLVGSRVHWGWGGGFCGWGEEGVVFFGVFCVVRPWGSNEKKGESEGGGNQSGTRNWFLQRTRKSPKVRP